MPNFLKKDLIINNLILHTESFGNSSDPACLLIAAKQATARFWTDEFCEYLAGHGLFIIRYDHRDVGESSAIDWNNAPYTMQDMAKDATLVLDGYSIKKAHFIGSSLGGWLCQWIGVNHPERVLSLAIISAVPIEITDKTAMPLSTCEQDEMDNASKMFITRKDGVTLEKTIQSYLPIWDKMNGEFLFDEQIAKDFTIDFLTRTKNKNAGKNHELMLSAYLSMMKRLGALQKIKIPTLVIHGDKDTVIPLRLGKALADAITTAKLVVVSGMGHSFFNRELEKRIAMLIVEHVKSDLIL